MGKSKLRGGLGRLRTPRSLARAAITVASAAVVLAVPLAHGKPAPDPTKLIVTGLGKPVQATLAYQCLPDGKGGGSCTAAPATLKPTGIVTLRPHARVTLLLGDAANYVRWSIGRVGRNGKPTITSTGQALAATSSRKRWRFSLPDRIGRATFMGFYALYPNASASWVVGARVKNR
jgi:hypothetical protein